MSKEYGEVKIPKNILKKIEERINDTEFGSVEEYIIFVLQEVLREDEEGPEDALSEEDEKTVKERLKALGYLD